MCFRILNIWWVYVFELLLICGVIRRFFVFYRGWFLGRGFGLVMLMVVFWIKLWLRVYIRFLVMMIVFCEIFEINVCFWESILNFLWEMRLWVFFVSGIVIISRFKFLRNWWNFLGLLVFDYLLGNMLFGLLRLIGVYVLLCWEFGVVCRCKV